MLARADTTPGDDSGPCDPTVAECGDDTAADDLAEKNDDSCGEGGCCGEGGGGSAAGAGQGARRVSDQALDDGDVLGAEERARERRHAARTLEQPSVGCRFLGHWHPVVEGEWGVAEATKQGLRH